MASAFGGFMKGFASGYGTAKDWQLADKRESREEAKEVRAGEEHAQLKRIREFGIKKAELEMPVIEKELHVRGAKADFDLTEQGFQREMQTFEQNTRRLLEQNKQRGAAIEGGALAAQQRNQPDELAVAREELNNKVLTGMRRQTANLWHVLKLGNKDMALKMYNDSQLVTPGEKAKDFRIEGEGDKRMLVVVPEGKGKGRRLPISSLEALENQFGAKYEKVGSDIVRIGRDGSITPVFQGGTEVAEGDAGGLFFKKGPKAGQRIPAAAGGGAPDAPAPGSQAAARIDTRVKMAVDKVLMPRYGGRFEGGVWFPDTDNKDVATRATEIAGQLIRRGMDPEAAGVQAARHADQEKEQADRAKVIQKVTGGKKPGSGGYTGARPWLGE